MSEFGYHLRAVKRGTLGDFSKIEEEVDEMRESIEQCNPIMALVEMSDLLGAMKAYLAKHHPSINLLDLMAMSNATERAFKSGRRTSK